MVTKFKALHGVYIFIGLWIFVFTVALLKPDPLINEAFIKLNETTGYDLNKNQGVEYKLPHQGTLGKMFLCLKEYRSGSFRKPKYETGKSTHKWIKIKASNYLIWMRVSAHEVYSFSVAEIDEKNRELSRSELYAVNCDLGLLNS